MSYARVADRLKAARKSANQAMQNAGILAQAVAEDMRYKAGTYDIPDLNDTLADLASALETIKTVRAVIQQANPVKVTTVVVGNRGAVEVVKRERLPRTSAESQSYIDGEG
jgi:RecA/RadA recombinase